MKATILLFLLFVGGLCAKAVHPHRHYHVATPGSVADTTLVFSHSGSRPYSAIELRIGVKEPRRLHTGDSPAWFELGCNNIRFIARRYSAIADNVHDGSSVNISIYSGDNLLASASARGVKPTGTNSYLLEWNATSDTLYVFTGSNRLEPSLRVALQAPQTSNPLEIKIIGQAAIELLVTEEKEIGREQRLAGVHPDSLPSLVDRDLFKYPDGIYHYLDRSSDPAIARPGGRYSLAVAELPETPGTHAIYYLSGAEVESSFWKPGMIKGYLKATPFRNQYDLEWFDSHGNPIPGSADSYASVDELAGTLTLTFPSLDGASLRFARTTTH